MKTVNRLLIVPITVLVLITISTALQPAVALMCARPRVYVMVRAIVLLGGQFSLFVSLQLLSFSSLL